MVDFKKLLNNKKGNFDKFVAFDCETSGMNWNGDPSKDYQIISAGLIVSDFSFTPIEKLYVEIKWNRLAKWDQKAQDIHGFTKEYLDKNGIIEETAVEKIGGLFYDHFGMDNPIVLLGQNVCSFDLPFLRKLLTNHGLPFKFAHRQMDTFSLGIGTIGAYNSDELFDIMGFEKRKSHNALQDAQYALDTFKIINKMWKKYVEQE